MKSFGSLTVPLIPLLLQAVQADFDIYRVGIGNNVSGYSEGWQAYSSKANCDNALGWLLNDRDHVSGDDYQVFCEDEGLGCGRSEEDSATNIVVLAFTNPALHYYVPRNRALVDSEDNVVGTCYPMSGPLLTCNLETGRIEGYPKLRCETDLTADDINGNGPN